MTPLDPEELEATGAPAAAEISADTRLGPAHLTVADLDRSIDYYRSVLGLELSDRGGGQARLAPGGGGDVLVLIEEPGARPAHGYSGLYHFALLVPERVDLARWLAHVARERFPLTGLSDHFVSEAIYLSDPDAHGIEIYWDRPRELWEGQADRLTTLPLDTTSVLDELDDPATEPFEGLPPGTVMGHVHLRVADITPTIAFYRDVLGLGLMASMGHHAAFLGAGGYHHHVGANTWESARAPQAPPGFATLRQATIVLPDASERDRLVAEVARSGQEPEHHDGAGVLVHDPSGNPIVLEAAGSG